MESIVKFNGEILFRRKFGKNLCFLSIINKEQNKKIECVLTIPQLIKEITLGDVVDVEGLIEDHKGHQKIKLTKLTFLSKGDINNCINKKRKEVCDLINSDTKATKCLCKKFIRGLPCTDPDCQFRHSFKDEAEKNNFELLRKKNQAAYDDVHEGDPFAKEEKHKKGRRNSEFADFIVKTFGIEYLKTRFVIDVAGGKGLTSFYLTTKYGIKCVVVDPRGTTLPKRYQKELDALKCVIEEQRTMFTKETAHNFINSNCGLIIGMHPDEATNDIVDVAVENKINFCVVPCCVFHSKFPERKLKNGKEVIEYNDLIEFLLEKEKDIGIDFLNIEGRNRVLYKKYN